MGDTGGVAISVLYGKGDGTFQAAQNFGIGHGPSSLVVDDFDLDGLPDIAAVDTGDGNIGLLLSRCGM